MRLFATFVSLVVSTLAFASPRLTYMREWEGQKQIFVSNADGSHVQAVTSGDAWHLYPSISADGSWVAYVQGDGKYFNVFLKQLETGRVEQWTTDGGMHLHTALSGNSEWLAFSLTEGSDPKSRIGLVNLKETRAKVTPKVVGGIFVYDVKPEILVGDDNYFFPALSSSGDSLIFQRSKSKTQKDILLQYRGEKEFLPLTAENGVAMAPALSADQRWLAYTSHRNGNWDIYLLDKAAVIAYANELKEKKKFDLKLIYAFVASQEIRVTTDKGRDFAPTFSPDGSLVFAADRTGNFQLYRIPKEEMRAKSFQASLFVKGAGDFYRPAFSGDTTIEQRVLADMISPPRSSFGAARLGNKIYVCGGHKGREHTYPPESFVKSLEVYDFATGKWSTLAPRPAAAHGYGLAAVTKTENGKTKNYLYAFGGFAYSAEHSPKWKSLDLVDRYDIDADKWETVAKLKRPRSSNVVGQVGNKVYLIAGWNSTPKFPKDIDGEFLRSIEVFDLDTEKVTESKIVLPDPLRRALSGIVVGDEIWLVGGIGQGGSHFALIDNVTAFNTKTGAWRELPRLPFPTFAPAAGVIGGDLYMFGGMFKTGPMSYEYVNHSFVLEAGKTDWLHTGRYLTNNKGFSMVVPLAAKTLGILGGHTYDGEGDGPVLTFETFGKKGTR